jgi:PPK2 family polyphosphate:nucleotide phosphotransferase
MMRIDASSFLVRQDERHPLADRPTLVEPFYTSTGHFDELLASHVEELSEFQRRLYAANRFALLVILQGMDASGKDGVIRHVMSGVNPQGVQVFSFSHPSATELQHDFLWREVQCLPPRGRIGIFNRSHYEEVLIVRVHPEILRGEGVPGGKADAVWNGRFRSIVDFEHHLHRNGTRILKFLLHVSREEQRRRLLARLDAPHKHWKFSLGDVHERRYWSRYMAAYDACLGATSRDHAPWYVVPADDKLNARLIVSQVMIDALAALRLRYPAESASRRRELRAIRRQLAR